jgi:ubiquinol-cytochrome c reductase cytochrome b subunit
MQKLLTWVDERFPLTKAWEEHIAKYYAPKNFNFWYYFGSLALLVLVMQIVSGIFLAMHYKPDVKLAFASVEYIMRDVPWGWLIRYMHSTGASAFFIVVYLHMFRGLIYGSHREPRELIWLIGVVIYIVLMAESFMGYLLPWGNMSYWGAQVIISLFDAVPWVGPPVAEWIRGDFVVSDATLTRFFSLHIVAMPLLLVGLVYVHIVALHKVGSNNPDGIEIKKKKGPDGLPLDGIPFHPYYSVKDMVGVTVFLILFAASMFFAPELGGWFLEHDNFAPANILQTPPEIKPLWYFTPYYSILRANTVNFFWIPGKLWGVFFMGFAIVLFFFLPWLDRSPVKSIRYRGWIYKTALTIFVISFIILGYVGTRPPEGLYKTLAQVCTIL